ncbi:MAG: hypothetical protein CFE40_06725 [Burkholderiales bacterium PBB1]|nr:MAG: hypothetical protein CFE40_06725 [Burkholderiales bacterium PBB1]
MVNISTRRLIYVCSRDHAYTFVGLPEQLRERGVTGRVLSYETLWSCRLLPRGTYVMTDFDRLSPVEHEMAGRLHDHLQEAGLPVLNNPRHYRPRDSFLKMLHAEGLNGFTCYLPSAGERPQRYPVFLRTIAAHRGTLSDLLHDQVAADTALLQAIDHGYLLRDLIFVEYAAEPQPDTGSFQKHAAFRVGPHIIRANTVNDAGWVAKNGTEGLASAEQYLAERAEMDTYPHHDYVMKVFELAGLQFGRLDFGIVCGRPQAYEINTNPTMSLTLAHRNAIRSETMRLVRSRLASALADVTQPVSRLPLRVPKYFKKRFVLGHRPRRF